VGRAFEFEQVLATLAERRLVTLVGPAGVGKTRLAVEAARAVAADRSVLVVELSPLDDPGALPGLLAAEVGVPAVPGRDPLEAVAARLTTRPALLVLDTCEHLVDAVATAASTLLRRAPGLRVLATSRQPLGIEGEVAWRVPPLELADAGAATLVDVEPSGAVRLFVDRARAVRADFALTDDNAADIAAICRTLDGLPLAISLAAARTNLLSPAGILARLDDRFALLSRGGRDAERRQRSLRAAVEWSYDLLGPDEQRLFRRLGAFPSSFDLAAAAAVAGEDDVFEALGDLVDRSLVVARDDRFVLLDTLRAFAADLLATEDDADGRDGTGAAEAAARARHADWYAGIALAADPVSHGPLPGRSEVLRREWANLLAALDWSFAAGRAAAGARLAGALAGFLVVEGRLVEADRWLTRARTVPADDATVASVHRGVGMLDLYRSRWAEARAACGHGVAAARRTGDGDLVASTLLALGTADWGVGEYDLARRHHGEAAELFARVGDDRGRGFALARLGRTLSTVGDPAAVATLEEGERLLAASDGGWMHTVGLEHLAGGLLADGRVAEAVARAEQAVDRARAAGSHVGELAALLTLGRAHLADGDPAGAVRAHRSALARALAMTHPGGTAEALDALAADCEDDRPGLAAELRGCAAAVRDEHHVTLPPAAARAREAAVARSRARLGPDAAAERESAGRARSPAWAADAVGGASA
jgi:predicted ATPase